MQSTRTLAHNRVCLMLKKIFDRFLNNDESEAPKEISLELATAVFMVEVARVDMHFDASEIARMLKLLQKQFDLSDTAAAELLDNAKQESELAVSLDKFSLLINKNCDLTQRRHIVQQLWQVAYADDSLDRYEEHIIRKVADLLYLPSSQLMQAKNDAQKNS